MFPRLLETSLWITAANQPGLIRLFRAYFSKHALFEKDLRGNMAAILDRFVQYGLKNHKAEVVSFDLINAVFKYLPLDYYRDHLKTVLTALLEKLRRVSKCTAVYKAFVVSMSLFTRVHEELLLPTLFHEVQPELFVNVVQHVWIPALSMIRKPAEKKVCAHSLARLMVHYELAPIIGDCCQRLMLLLNLHQAETPKLEEKEDIGGEFEVVFSKLSNTDIAQDVDTYKVQQLDIAMNIKEVLKPHAQRLVSLPNLQPLFAYLS